MKKELLLALVLCCFFNLSCSYFENDTSLEPVNSYDENDNLIETVIYKDNTGENFVEIEYFEDGQLRKMRQVVDGLMKGSYIVNNKDEDQVFVGVYDRKNEFQIINMYNIEGDMLLEKFLINDSLIVGRRIAMDVTDSNMLYYIYTPYGEEEGYYFINDSLAIVKSTEHKYYQTKLNNIAFVGNQFSILVEILNKGGDKRRSSLVIDSDTIDSENDSIQMSFRPECEGQEIYYGELFVWEDTIINNAMYSKDYKYTFYQKIEVVSIYDYMLPYFDKRNNYLYDFDTIPLVKKVLGWMN